MVITTMAAQSSSPKARSDHEIHMLVGITTICYGKKRSGVKEGEFIYPA